jgi:hypothetical protein
MLEQIDKAFHFGAGAAQATKSMLIIMITANN